jgi:hypothetical protein
LNWISKSEQVPYYYCNGEKEKICNEKITLDWSNEILKFEYMPGRSDVWIVLVNDGIYAVEVDHRSDRNIQKIYLAKTYPKSQKTSCKKFLSNYKILMKN